ncbi:MAG: hypothetical protein LBR36_00915 [Bacteroidales bacterium]|nr:hypothetical protein [Bacteroidales bacterium]
MRSIAKIETQKSGAFEITKEAHRDAGKTSFNALLRAIERLFCCASTPPQRKSLKINYLSKFYGYVEYWFVWIFYWFNRVGKIWQQTEHRYRRLLSVGGGHEREENAPLLQSCKGSTAFNSFGLHNPIFFWYKEFG